MMSQGHQRTHGTDHGIAGAISQELHKTAQPLTALLGLLELSLQRAQTVQQYRHSVEKAIEQLQRVTDCFGHIRNIVGVQPSSSTPRFKLRSLIDAVARDLQSKLDAAGVKLLLHPQAGVADDLAEEEIAGSLSGHLYAMSLVISGLLTFLKSGDHIEISVEKDHSHVLLRIQSTSAADPSSAVTNPEGESMATCLRLAQEMMAGNNSSLKVCHPPSTVFITLPRASAAVTGGRFGGEDGTACLA